MTQPDILKIHCWDIWKQILTASTSFRTQFRTFGIDSVIFISVAPHWASGARVNGMGFEEYYRLFLICINFGPIPDFSELSFGSNSWYMRKSPARALLNKISRFLWFWASREKPATTWTYHFWWFLGNSSFFTLKLKFRKMSLEIFTLNFLFFHQRDGSIRITGMS